MATISRLSRRSRASYGARWVAAMIDFILGFMMMGPGYLASTTNASSSSISALLLFTGLSVFVGIQVAFLVRDGQSIGKKLMGLRIVMANTGEHPGWARLLLLRGLLSLVISMLPYIGQAYVMVNTLFIFREDRRCLHDHLAGTMVVND